MNKTILVVDDDERSRKLARDIVAYLGYIAIEAPSAEQAIELARRAPPALVLMDIRLPGMSGVDALVQLRTTLQLPNIPVVAVTASAMSSEKDSLISKGFNDHVAKPYHYQDLATIVKKLLH